MKYTNLKLGEILINDGLLTEEVMGQALEKQKGSGKRIGEVLISEGFITEMQLIQSLSSQLEIEYIDLETVKADPDLAALVPERIAKANGVIPFEKKGSELKVALSDPLNYGVIQNISNYSKMNVTIYLAERQKIEYKIHELYVAGKAMEAARELSGIVDSIPKEAETFHSSDQPIVRFVNMMIEQAILLRASDIHIEPGEEKLNIRYRVDGMLMPYHESSVDIAPAVVSRIKFIGGMNIAEKRLPQDGRINYKSGDLDVDLRISSIPTVYGEKVVMRIATALDMNLIRGEIGFLEENNKRFDRILSKDHGIILMTGPTGSGKSTTLYTVLREKNKSDINITTVENPVENIIEGISQVDINTKAGLTFANVLRSILRQDPDIIMVGEIRDDETANIATAAAITGHLVLSTLHTYDAPSAVVRLIDMGVEPFMVSASLIGVVSQRLIRKVCPRCKVAYEANDEELKVLGYPAGERVVLYKGTGCSYCSGTGHKGRTAIHEVMPITKRIKKAIYDRNSIEDIRDIALQEGMMTLFDNLKIRVLEGVSSFEEVLKLYTDLD